MMTILVAAVGRAACRFAIMAALLGVALALPAAPAIAAADEGLGVIHGYLYRSDETTRLAGAEVAAINVNTGRRYLSARTGENGAYEIAGIPPGTYDIAIDTKDENVYVTDSLIDLNEKQHLTLSFALKPKGGATPGAPASGGASMIFTDPHAVSPGATTPPGKPSTDGGSTGKKTKEGTEAPKKKHSTPSSGSGSSASFRPSNAPPAAPAA
jgi:hypothetical protein